MIRKRKQNKYYSPSYGNINPLKTALLLALFYFIIGAIYIFISGKIAADVAQTVEELAAIEMIKGNIYVVVTGILLFIFAYFLLKMTARHQIAVNAYRNELIAAERRAAAGLFASSVAHDINNILMVIDYMTQSLQSKEEADYPEILQQLTQAHQKLRRLVKRLDEATGQTLAEKVKRFDLISAVQEIVTFSQSHQKVKNCKIRTEWPSTISFSGKEVLIHQMLLNLIINAADAAAHKGSILIRVHNLDNGVKIEVHDNGPGISSEIKENMMQPFITTKQEGSGLGLLSVKACAEAHNGKIDLEKSDLGGACIAVFLKNLDADSEQNVP